MKICLSILALLVVSACAVELKPKPLDYELNKKYVYEYTGNVLTGIPSSSSLYSGTQLKANVAISHSNDRTDLYTLKLDNVTFASLIDEVTEPAKANFARWEAVEQKNQELLELTVQYQVNKETQRLEYIEVHQMDVPWSLNIKKAIIEMFLVDIAGKQLKLAPGYEHGLTKHSQDEVHHAFDVYEPTLKGECETMYQVINALPENVNGLPGSEQFYWKVIKTRNYQNCTTTPRLTQHNWERKGCVEYCKQALIVGLTKMNNYYSAEKSQCNCNDIEIEPLDQQLTSTYSIECMENPYILSAESNGKVTFDNHGTRFVTYTNQTLKFVRIHGGIIDPINTNYAIRAQNLTFSLYPYLGSVAYVFNHEIPVYNLLVPSGSQSTLLDTTVELLNRVAETVIEGDYKNQKKVASLMQKVVSRLAHLDSEHIMRIFSDYCIVPEAKLYTNTLESVRRQLFLDAVSHVGTQNVSIWLEQVLGWNSNGLSPIEVRQIVETLPLNVYAPTTQLIELLEKKINGYFQEEDWDSLSAFVIAYGKLIAKACPNPEVYPESDNEITIDESRVRVNNWWIPEDQKCTAQQTLQYIKALSAKLMSAKSVRGKLLIAQALAHTGKVAALEELESYVKGELKTQISDVSDRTFFRTSVIYSLHHMISVAPKRIRSLVLPVFNKKTESYELRLAAFTVLMSAGPKRHELDSVAVSLRNETNHQVITMVRSILEETANLTQACHQPLAQAAREIVATLPEVNLDGVYSQASYNEWFSTDKSTGFFANGQFVANNITIVPRHGYLSLGSHWKSLSNPWFTVAFQQKGLETALKQILNPASGSYAVDPKTIDELWKDRSVNPRVEDEFMLKLFVRVYEQTSLFTMDKYTLQNAYDQFVRVMLKFVNAASNDRVDFNWVRFYMPSTYTDVVPSAVGLPILATKQNRQIVSLRLTKSEFESKPISEITTGSITFKVTPQVFSSSLLSLAVFNQGLKSKTHYGVYTNKDFNVYVPVSFSFGWDFNTRLYTYAIKPAFEQTNFLQSNANYAFIIPSYIGTTKVRAITKEIQSLVPAYNHPLVQFKSRELGMNLNLGLSTERPWFIDLTEIPCEGTVAWLLEKYNEMNQFNNNINLTLVQNEEYPASGFVGSFRYEQDIDGEYVAIGETNPSEETNARRIVQDLIQRYPSEINNPAFFARSIEFYLATFGHPEPTEFNSTLTLGTAIDNHAYWFRFNSTLDNKNEDLWTRVARKAIIDGKVERPVIPSDLLWRNPEKFIGNYIANIAWASNVRSEQPDSNILVKGELRRSPRDPVIPEMERESWFHKQCKKDIKNGNATNHACERVIAEQAYFNVVTGKIEFREVQEPVRESIRKVYSELKRSLMYYWKPWSNISSERFEGEQDVVTFAASYSNIIYKRPVINFFVQTPTEKVNFTKIFVPVALFPTMHPINYLKASPMPKDQTCTLMKDSIRTFDNVTYRTWLDECEFIASMDCSQSQKFAVTVKGQAGKRTVRVYTPLQNYYKLYDVKKDSASLTVYNSFDQQQGPDYVLTPGKPAIRLDMLPNTRYHEAHQIFMHDGVVNVVLPKENVRVAFDGHYLKITTSPLFVGKTCGLCGNQDQEFYPEFLDPGMVNLASNLTAFRDSYSLHNCTDPNPCHDDVCDVDAMAHPRRSPKFLSAGKSDKKASIQPELRTIVIKRENDICLSKFPEFMCPKNFKPTTTTSKQIDLVCLPNAHPTAHLWAKEAEKRLITEVRDFDSTETSTYDRPTKCVAESVRGI
ncbi:vitellogenin-6-like [Tetranychus urticae]|uniref:Vitellogenin n=1 Tax=Tetranychus urticae TaxID=32264 RepID=T1L4P3_TETUR|nr:vitellogenin-6-like [Tetranychus urticae]